MSKNLIKPQQVIGYTYPDLLKILGVVGTIQPGNKKEKLFIEVTKVPMGQLFHIPEEQRPLNLPRIREMAANWKWHMCHPLVVAAPIKGKNPVVDGAHRGAGLFLKFPNGKYKDGSPVMVPVIIVQEAKTSKDRISLFLDLNGFSRKSVTAKQMFTVMLNGQFAREKNIENALKENRITISVGGPRQPNQTKATPALAKIYDKLGYEKFRAMIKSICWAYTDGDGNVERSALESSFLSGFASFFFDYTERDFTIIRAALSGASRRSKKRRDATTIVSMAQKLRTGGSSRSLDDAIARVLKSIVTEFTKCTC